MHSVIDPAILYFGTPVALFGARSQTPANLLRTGECVLNLPSVGCQGIETASTRCGGVR